MSWDKDGSKVHNKAAGSRRSSRKYDVRKGPFERLNPTSINANRAKIVVTITHEDVINCAPVTPTFLPKKPETIDPNKGKIIILKYIIYILLLYFLLIYRKQLKYLNL
jgi:hypothetical protein